MSRSRLPLIPLAFGILLACAASTAAQAPVAPVPQGGASASAQDPAAEEFARRQYESGLAFLGDRKYAEAMKDFQAVVSSYPASRVADAALLRIAEYQFDVAGDTAAAQASVDTIQKKYATSESGPMALVLAGRILLAKGRAAADVDAALASYERVPRLFPGSDAVPAAIFYSGEALRLTHRDGEAVLRYRQVSTDHPQSIWAPRALLGEARCLVTTGKPARAMELLQRVRQRFPGTAEAATAGAWNTILYRLYLRAPAQPAYQFSNRTITGTAGRIQDVTALAVHPNGVVYAASKNTVLPFDPAGKMLPSLAAVEPRAILFTRAGLPVAVFRDGLLPSGGTPMTFAVPKPDDSPRQLEDIAAAAFTSTGEVLVTDKNARAIARFSPDGKSVGPFASVNAVRLAVDVTDRVATLDSDDGVEMFEQDGKMRWKLAQRGQGWEFGRPVDIAIDPLGHVYVLDRNRATVFVFSADQQPKLLTAFSIPAKSPGYFKKAACFALDVAGRLYIYDDDVEKILVYQ